MAFQKLGSENFVNTTTAGEQYGSAVTQLIDGDIVVAWTEQDGSDFNVRAQILDSDGQTKDGAEFMLNTTLTGDQFDVALTALGNGGFAAGWTSSAVWAYPTVAAHLYVNNVTTQAFTANGDPYTVEVFHFLDDDDDEYAVGRSWSYEHTQGSVALAADTSEGGFAYNTILTEEMNIGSDFGENSLVKFSNSTDGTILNEQVEDVTYAVFDGWPDPAPELDQFHDPQAIVLADGTCVTAYWREANNSNLGGVHIDFPALSNTVRIGSDEATGPAISELTNGNLIAVWTDTVNSSDGNEDIRGQILAPDGDKIGGEFAVTDKTGSQWTPAVAALADGRFVVVWEDLSGTGGDASGSSIKAQIFTAGGIKSGPEFLVNSVTADTQYAPTVTGLADGNFMVTWTSTDGATKDIKSQVFDPRHFTGDGADDTVYGGDDDDTLDGGAGTDTLFGEGGNDVFENVTLDDLSDGDVFDGGDGVDTIDFDNYVYTLFGPDPVLIGGDGTMDSIEVLNLHGSSTQAGLNFIELAIPLANSSSTGRITVNGGLAPDIVYGDRIANADVSLFLNGNGGDDHLVGGAGDDTLDGWDGVDTLEGGGGDDVFAAGLEGIIGGDVFDGGAGIDTLDFRTSVGPLGGFSILIGGGGTVESVEIINLHGSTGSANEIVLDGNIADTVSFGATVPGAPLPSVIVNGSDADDTVDASQFEATGIGPVVASLRAPQFVSAVALTFNGGGGADHFIGGSGADTIHGGIGADTMAGGAGDDTYFIDDAGDAVTEAANAGTDLVIATTSAVLSANVENLILAGLGFVNGIGNGLANIMEGGAGVNMLTGLGGDDELYGLGNNDLLWGGLGADTLDGGTGSDTATYAGSTAAVDIDLAADTASGGAATGDTLDGIENLVGTGFNDKLTGDDADNALFGAEGRDVIHGGIGADVIIGGGGKDTLNGDAGNDTITGSDIEDTLRGGSENDRMIGGLGNDVYVGGSGLDTFVFTDDTEGNNDRIDDWLAVDDQLEIDASAFGGGLAAGALAANRLVVGASPVASQAFGQFLYNTANGQLLWDIDGTGATAAVTITKLLNGGVTVGTLAVGDFDIVA